jgi:hypothetical protein
VLVKLKKTNGFKLYEDEFGDDEEYQGIFEQAENFNK